MDEAAQQCLVPRELNLDEPATMASALAEEEATTSPVRSSTAQGILPPSSPMAGKRKWAAGTVGGLAAAGMLLAGGTALARHMPNVTSSLAAPAAKKSQQLWGGGNGPSLFCWCIMRTQGYERDILEAQFGTGTGIFQCDDVAVFSEESVLLGGEFETEGIGAVSSQLGGQGPLATGSWVNTESFFRAWAALRDDGRFSGYDWVIKVDPDTVLFPDLLKQHIAQQGMAGQVNAYLNNCPDVDNGFYGCVEAMSQPAFSTLMDRFEFCRETLPYEGWGEDLFAQSCMDASGVGMQGDYGLVLDGNCHGTGAPPRCMPGRPAFHPLKSADAWLQCWSQAGGNTDSFVRQDGPQMQPSFLGEGPEYRGEEPGQGGEFLGPRGEVVYEDGEGGQYGEEGAYEYGEGGEYEYREEREGGKSWLEMLGLPSYHRKK